MTAQVCPECRTQLKFEIEAPKGGTGKPSCPKCGWPEVAAKGVRRLMRGTDPDKGIEILKGRRQ